MKRATGIGIAPLTPAPVAFYFFCRFFQTATGIAPLIPIAVQPFRLRFYERQCACRENQPVWVMLNS
jgi:hypothetical protein